MKNIVIISEAADKKVTKRMTDLLAQNGWAVWWDENIPVGQDIEVAIQDELNRAACVIVLWSKTSVKSSLVKDAAERAKRLEKLIPVCTEDVEVPLGFGQFRTLDLFDWDGTHTHPGINSLFRTITSYVTPKKPQLHG